MEKSVLFTRGHHKSLETCFVPMPVIVSNFIALGQTMYEKSVTKRHRVKHDRQTTWPTDRQKQ